MIKETKEHSYRFRLGATKFKRIQKQAKEENLSVNQWLNRAADDRLTNVKLDKKFKRLFKHD